MKLYPEIVRSLYDLDVLAEDTILLWFRKGSNSKAVISISFLIVDESMTCLLEAVQVLNRPEPFYQEAERCAIEQSTSDYDKEKLQERLTILSGGVVVLKTRHVEIENRLFGGYV
ncbi:hypothetical protein FCM35_KLT20589 [Carex littledalei]|uniref:Uncharacterized protein n=1 Tax=Carex littledalei TaxID=544730 RepID=A0A833RD29_9POAL|nr:hypothetical protein FCM35_KLT20589 [Carex littledalei]